MQSSSVDYFGNTKGRLVNRLVVSVLNSVLVHIHVKVNKSSEHKLDAVISVAEK